jgi:hypothetical protein
LHYEQVVNELKKIPSVSIFCLSFFVKQQHIYILYNGKITNFCLHDEQTVNGLRKIACASVFLLIFFLKRQHTYMDKGTNSKRQCPFVCYKWKTEMANFRLFDLNRKGKEKFVFLFGK